MVPIPWKWSWWNGQSAWNSASDWQSAWNSASDFKDNILRHLRLKQMKVILCKQSVNKVSVFVLFNVFFHGDTCNYFYANGSISARRYASMWGEWTTLHNQVLDKSERWRSKLVSPMAMEFWDNFCLYNLSGCLDCLPVCFNFLTSSWTASFRLFNLSYHQESQYLNRMFSCPVSFDISSIFLTLYEVCLDFFVMISVLMPRLLYPVI